MVSLPMLKRMCTAKIANAFVTKAELHYEGSMGIDSAVLEASGIRPYEMILIANVTNGRRFETYTIPEPAGSGAFCLYGGAAHMGQPGDELIIMAYGYLNEAEVSAFKAPRVVRLAAKNKLA
jgi:aspartate 1-decarboxylase